MRSTLALVLSLLAVALATLALLRPVPPPAPALDGPPVIAFPPIDSGGAGLQPYPDAWLPSAWDPDDR